MSTSLVLFDRARRALEEARTIDEVKDVRDKAEALRLYMKQAGESLEMQNGVAEIKLRAERRAGELLAGMPMNTGGRPAKNLLHDVTGFDPETLEELGIERIQAHRWKTIADLPEEKFEQHIAEVKATSDAELTTAGVLRLARTLRRNNHHEGLEASELPTGTYRVFYADPPWRYSDSGVIGKSDNYGRAERHYPTLSIDELCAMGEQIKDISEDNAVLFLWATSPMLENAFKVINAWGFKYKTSFVWDKVRHNFGHYNSVRHEFLLVATRGSCVPDVDLKFDSVVSVERSDKHSEKPVEFRNIIETLYPHGSRIELFARETHENWNAWGNEAR